MKNIVTTIAGICTLLIAASSVFLSWYHQTPVDWTAVGGELTGGLGLLKARDAKKTDLTPDEAVTVKTAVQTGAIQTGANNK